VALARGRAAVRGRRRCRMHGGAHGSGGPVGPRNAPWDTPAKNRVRPERPSGLEWLSAVSATRAWSGPIRARGNIFLGDSSLVTSGVALPSYSDGRPEQGDCPILAPALTRTMRECVHGQGYPRH
jgi:hypothetical protein